MTAYGVFHAALPPLSPALRRRVRGRHGLLPFRPRAACRVNHNYTGSYEAMADPYAFPGPRHAGIPSPLMVDADADRDTLRASGGACARELADAGTPVD